VDLCERSSAEANLSERFHYEPVRASSNLSQRLFLAAYRLTQPAGGGMSLAMASVIERRSKTADFFMDRQIGRSPG